MDKNAIIDTDTSLLISTFFLGQAAFGLDANRVLEIVPVKSTTVVHGAPNYVWGVMNLRGRVVTIIDAAQKIKIGIVESNPENRILIIEWMQEHVGLLVDRVTEVTQLSPDMMLRTPDNVHGIRAELISGVFKNQSGNLVAMVDIDKTLEMTE